jgi:hypothetical protein
MQEILRRLVSGEAVWGQPRHGCFPHPEGVLVIGRLKGQRV